MSLDLEKFLTKINKEVLNLNNYNTIKYNKNDIRVTFFQKYNNILRVFYTGFNSIYICNNLQQPINGNFSKEKIIHLENFGYLLFNSNWYSEYINQLKLAYITNTWSCFESDISIIFDEMIDNKDIIKLRKIKKDIGKYIESPLISDFEFNSKISNYYLPINYKLKKILKELGVEDRYNIENFCEFYMTMRNCIHNNSIYFGSDKIYKNILGLEISFKNKKEIDFATPDFLLLVSIELIEIFKKIIEYIPNDRFISDIYINNLKSNDT